MSDKTSGTAGEFSLDRMKAFSDGVIAIAITILAESFEICLEKTVQKGSWMCDE